MKIRWLRGFPTSKNMIPRREVKNLRREVKNLRREVKIFRREVKILRREVRIFRREVNFSNYFTENFTSLL